jgi:hypothetical protein
LVFGSNSSPTTSGMTAMMIEYQGLSKMLRVCDAMSVAREGVTDRPQRGSRPMQQTRLRQRRSLST